MVPFAFVHAADLHLDSPFKGLSGVPDAVRQRLRESAFASMQRVVDTARREHADFVVLAGDLYDSADRSLRAQLRLKRMLEELAEDGIGVFAVHGNHDPESGRQAMLDWPGSVHIFGSSSVGCVPAYRRDGKLAAYVYGISYAHAAVTENLALRFVKREGAPFHLAVLHGNVDGIPGHDPYAPCRLAELTAAGFDYWALGHVHDRRVLHEYPHVVYPGNIQGRSMRETGPKGAYLVRVSETGQVSLDFKDTADVLWQEAEVRIDGVSREQDLMERLLSAAQQARAEASGRPVVLRFRLEGRGAIHEKLLEAAAAEEWLEELREILGPPEERDDWVWADSLVVRTFGETDWERLAEEDGFLGELTRLGLRTAGSPESARLLIEEALASLRRQPRIREWLSNLDDGQCAELVRRGLETAVSMLRDDERI
jgi:DNA repair exonuclease SbcCD nuclease subunit